MVLCSVESFQCASLNSLLPLRENTQANRSHSIVFGCSQQLFSERSSLDPFSSKCTTENSKQLSQTHLKMNDIVALYLQDVLISNWLEVQLR